MDSVSAVNLNQINKALKNEELGLPCSLPLMHSTSRCKHQKILHDKMLFNENLEMMILVVNLHTERDLDISEIVKRNSSMSIFAW